VLALATQPFVSILGFPHKQRGAVAIERSSSAAAAGGPRPLLFSNRGRFLASCREWRRGLHAPRLSLATDLARAS